MFTFACAHLQLRRQGKGEEGNIMPSYNRSIAGVIRNAAGNSVISQSVSGSLHGDFGSTQPPSIVEFSVVDPDNGDTILGVGERIA